MVNMTGKEKEKEKRKKEGEKGIETKKKKEIIKILPHCALNG